MPMTSVRLRPGVDTLMTLSQNEAGVSQSNLIRYQQGMLQKQGGWLQYYPVAIGSTIKELYGWQGITGVNALGIAATESLSVLISGSNTDITPQTLTRDITPDFSVSSGDNVVTIVDAGSSVSLLTTVYFNTPVSLGGMLLNGAYQVNTVIASSVFTILSSNDATSTVASSGILPIFTTSSGSGIVTVELPNNDFQDIPGLYEQFIAPTSVGGLTIEGPYQINTVIDSTSFQISAPTAASSVGTVTMNGGLAQLEYYYTIGAPAYVGYGVGPYGDGGYGTGTAAPAATGTPITADDWSLVNWGDLLMACPQNGPIYYWSPNIGFTNAKVIETGPFFNGGIFVSMPQQILVAWGSVQSTGVQDPLVVRWSAAEDYTNWNPSGSEAGSFHIPTGSIIKGGTQAATQGIIWTDIEVWNMQYVGQPAIFGFNRLGSGCGLVGMHAHGILQGSVYWMSNNNFYVLANSGVQVLKCPVWNFVFQNIDTNNLSKVRCATNAMFNEVTWFFPALGGTGENTLYARLNIVENEWDVGTLGRSAWIDVTVLGNPIGADTDGIIYQHETGYNDNTAAMTTSFETGYWSISDGNDLAFVDWVIPDMQYQTYAGGTPASLTITLLATDYPGQTPREYGPYTFTQGTQYINTRLRGRLMAMRVESADLNSFYRLGRIRYRFATDGRR